MKKKINRSSSKSTRVDRANTSAVRVMVALLCICLFALAFDWATNRIRPVNAAQGQDEKISDSALTQISSLMEAKLARTPAQQKIDSNLLAAIRVSRGEPIAANVPALQPNVKFEADGKVLVDIHATVTKELLGEIKDGGGQIVNSFEQYDAIRARIPLALVEPLAGSADVNFIRRAVEIIAHRATKGRPASRAFSPSTPSRSFASRASNVRTQLPHTLSAIALHKNRAHGRVVPYIDETISAGDITHRAAEARTTFGVNGTGVKIGVLSDSFNNLGTAATDVLTGDLPGPDNPNGFAIPVTVLEDLSSGGSDEGRAMLQIVHDLAPGARLYFATATGGPANFANNIQALRDNGCDVIIDDMFYVNESPFQDGLIAQAVNTVTNAGALYFSSAGNSGNLNDGTSGVWEGDFNDSGTDFIVDGNNVGRLHRFDVSTTLNTINAIDNSARYSDLSWSDALGQSANDYDLYILNAAGTTVLRFSNDNQTGSQDPYEFVDTINPGEKIAVVKFTGSARALHLGTGRGRLAIATSGQTAGHSCAVNAFNVAAVDVATANGGAFTGGAGNPVETFSSDGTRRVFYNSNGTAITPGNFLFGTNGGTVRQKPDIAAADGVATTLPPSSDLNPFFGTSAAAPHAGAIAGLLKSFKPALIPAQVRTILTSTALDIEAPGIDRDSGFGIVMALQALQAASVNGNFTIGLHRPSTSTFFLRNTNSTGFPDISVPFGAAGDLPVVGDWDGDGDTTIGLYRPSTSTFFLRNSNTMGFPDITVPFGDGPGGDIPIVGDWNGDGIWTIGVYRPSTSTFFLRNSNTVGFPDLSIPYGAPGDTPVVGDWNGDGTTTVGLYRPSGSIFFLRNSNSTGFPDITVPYGAAGDLPIVGDWNGDGTTTVGLYRPSGSIFFLRNSNTTGFPDITVPFGASGDRPLAGDWDGL